MVRKRAIQVGFLLTGLAAVVVADLMADRLAALRPAAPAGQFVALGGRVLGGFAVGLALRLQHARRARPDTSFRLLAGAPFAVIAASPVLLAVWPGPLPGADLLVAVQRLAPFAGALLGVILALSVRSTGR